MDFRLSPQAQAFRQEVRCFLAEALPTDFTGFEEESAESHDYWAFSREFARRLASRGWLAPAWPPEYGGISASPEEQWVLAEELGYHAAPFYNRTVSIVGPVLINFGTAEQKARFLAAIGRGEVEFCIGLTEPEHGSDLAGVECRAEAAGDGFLLHGQKVYSSNAHHADYCLLLARTDPQAPQHRGLSLFIVGLKGGGVEVRPLVNALGLHCFNELFLEGAAVPREGLVGGEPGRGWYQIVFALNHERTVHAAGIARAALYRRTLDDLVKYVSGTRGGVGEPLRGRLAALATEIEVFRLLSWRIAWMQARGVIPEWEAAMTKLLGSQLMGKLANLWAEAQGLYGQVGADPRRGVQGGRIERMLLSSVGVTIGGGTAEVLRNIIAYRGLGLPR